jgi:dihydroorotate dehydrogenase
MLEPILAAIQQERVGLAARSARDVPVVVKISPDLTGPELAAIAQSLLKMRIDGVIATNTTLSRPGVSEQRHSGEEGGLSGGPLRTISAEVVRQLRNLLGPSFPIIAVGGIASGEDARAAIDAGANLVQLYTGLIYRGPTLVREARRALRLSKR